MSAGYAAVWATENTRDVDLRRDGAPRGLCHDGNRMAVRLFGGYDFTDADAKSRNPAIAGYGKGVPMGGDLGATA